MEDLQGESKKFYQQGFDNLLKFIIKKIEEDANKAKVLKETNEKTVINLALQIGVIEGAYKVLRIIENSCRSPEVQDMA